MSFQKLQYKSKKTSVRIMLLPLLSALILILQVHPSSPQNLICNGDFQGHTLPYLYHGQKWQLFASNYSCWYNKNGGVYEIKQKFQPPVTSTGELVSTVPYALCQNVTLEIGSSYQLNFSVVNCWTMSFSTIIVDVNGQWLHNLTALGEFTVATGSKQFVATGNSSRICFDSTFQMNTYLYPWIGPCIDNITLIKVLPSITPVPISTNQSSNSTVQTNTTTSVNSTNSTPSSPTATNSSQLLNSTSNETFNPDSGSTSNSTFFTPTSTTPISNPIYNKILINCITTRSDTQNQVLFNCQHIHIWDDLMNMIKEGLNIYFESQLQMKMQFQEVQPTFIKLIVKPERSYSLQKIFFVLNDNVAQVIRGTGFQIQFYVDGVNMMFSLLSQEEIKTIQAISPLSSAVMTFMQNAYSILKVSFMSFFLIDIISFWNLSLMYNFLNLSAVPLFSKYFLQRLQNILFRLDSILQWLLTQVPHLRPYFNFDQVGGRQLVSEYKNGYAWFGSFGISSGYVRNNIEQLLIVGALIVKIGIMTGLRRIRILPKLLRKQFPRGLKIMQIFLTELTGIQIFMIVSATGALQANGFVNLDQKFNNALQIFTLLQGIITIPLCFLIDIKILKKNLLKNNNSKINQIHPVTIPPTSPIPANFLKSVKSVNFAYLTSINNLLQLLPYAFIPFLILFNSPQLFLAVNSLLIGARCWWFCRHVRVFEGDRREKLFMGINLALWVVHHCVYVGFWCIQKMMEWAKDEGWSWLDQPVMTSCSKVLGFITIFTVLLGGGFQLLNFLCSIVVFLFETLKKTYLTCKNRWDKDKNSENNPPHQKPPIKELVVVHCNVSNQINENIFSYPLTSAINIRMQIQSPKKPSQIHKKRQRETKQILPSPLIKQSEANLQHN